MEKEKQEKEIDYAPVAGEEPSQQLPEKSDEEREKKELTQEQIEKKSASCCCTVYVGLLCILLLTLVFLIWHTTPAMKLYLKTSAMHPIKCITVSSDFDGMDRVSCKSGGSKGTTWFTTNFPCLIIHVRYEDEDKPWNEAEDVHQLYNNEIHRGRQCSYYPACKTSDHVANASAHEFNQRYGTPGSNYICLYDTNEITYPIVGTYHTYQNVMLYMIFECVAIAFVLIILPVIICKRGLRGAKFCSAEEVKAGKCCV